MTLVLACWCAWNLAILLAYPAMFSMELQRFVTYQNAVILGMFSIVLGERFPTVLSK